jgi:hypothetical protein
VRNLVRSHIKASDGPISFWERAGVRGVTFLGSYEGHSTSRILLEDQSFLVFSPNEKVTFFANIGLVQRPINHARRGSGGRRESGIGPLKMPLLIALPCFATAQDAGRPSPPTPLPEGEGRFDRLRPSFVSLFSRETN